VILPTGILFVIAVVLVVLWAADRVSSRDAVVIFFVLVLLLLLFGGLRTA
jgi:hypothetical protein